MSDMKRGRALPLTITLGSILVVLALALTTLWNIVLIYNTLQLRQAIGREVWGQWVILGIGSFLFVVIIVGITLFIIFMSRQIILNQTQKNFIDSMTHELRTPITSLKLYVETLQRHELTGDKREQFLEHMLQDVEYLDHLVGHVLEAAKVEYRKSPERTDIAFDSLASECIETVRRRYRLEADVFSFAPNGLSLRSDPDALRLILINLLDNAVKYSPEPPRIVLRATQNGRETLIEVEDKGLGLSQSELKRIFKRFYRGSGADQAKGSGLGLFIVSETARQLHGRISAESPGPNQGTCFRLSLPS